MKSDKDLRNTIKFLLFLQRRESAAQNCTAMINIFNFLHLFMFLVFCRYENKKYFAHENMKICQNSVHLSELLTCALAFQGKVSCMIWLKLSLRIISVHYPHHHPQKAISLCLILLILLMHFAIYGFTQYRYCATNIDPASKNQNKCF